VTQPASSPPPTLPLTQPASSPRATLPFLDDPSPTHGALVQDGSLFPGGIPPLPAEYTEIRTVREESTMQEDEAFQQIPVPPTIPEVEDESVANTARTSEAPSPTHHSSATQQDAVPVGRETSIISEADSVGAESDISKRRGSSRLSAAIEKERRRISGVRRPSILPCAICFENQQEMAIDPCGHISMCHGCSQKVTVCPVCRGPISKALRVFLAGTG
jgi:hypothetical protein